MSRQLEIKQEERELARRSTLVKALDFGIVGALESQGVELLGIAFKHNAYDCLMTIKADVGGTRSISFVGSDTIINCILKAYGAASRNELRWRPDQYHTNTT